MFHLANEKIVKKIFNNFSVVTYFAGPVFTNGSKPGLKNRNVRFVKLVLVKKN